MNCMSWFLRSPCSYSRPHKKCFLPYSLQGLTCESVAGGTMVLTTAATILKLCRKHQMTSAKHPDIAESGISLQLPALNFLVYEKTVNLFIHLILLFTVFLVVVIWVSIWVYLKCMVITINQNQSYKLCGFFFFSAVFRWVCLDVSLGSTRVGVLPDKYHKKRRE